MCKRFLFFRQGGLRDAVAFWVHPKPESHRVHRSPLLIAPAASRDRVVERGLASVRAGLIMFQCAAVIVGFSEHLAAIGAAMVLGFR